MQSGAVFKRAAVWTCAQDTPGLRALGSKWARLLDNLPDVSQCLDASGCPSGKTYGIKISAGHVSSTIKSSEAENGKELGT